ncbi:MAG: transcriptional regulator [Thermoprotei archaeon]|nr:MAG: transcriptional regulator [Thermoprotei archaeon]
MNKDQVIGWGLLAVSAVIIAVYTWLVWFPIWTGLDLVLLKLTGTIAVIAVFGILGWIGYTLATTPPPKPIEEIEKEIEEEIKKLEEEAKKESREAPVEKKEKTET